ncbi:TPA: 6-phosphofructokinase [Candidatus Latescibacteria bacterium]|nr:6-phosphofructokinase [Candidatus Latescibacterota bacterium]
MKRIGILTAGGDTPALNATLHGAVARANQLRVEVVGLIKGFSSLHNPRVPHVHLNPLFREIPELDATQGGTIIGASRDYVDPEDREQLDRIIGRLNHLKVDGLICIGGDGTLNGLQPIAEQMPAVLAPKTIDNDLGLNYVSEAQEWVRKEQADGTVDYSRSRTRTEFDLEYMVNYVTPGYATAVFDVAMGINRVRTTAESHRRIAIVEVMGRDSGYIALGASYGQPDFILIPEAPVDADLLVEQAKELYELQKNVVIVCGEGISDESGEQLGAHQESPDPSGNVLLSGAAEAVRRILIERIGDRYFVDRRRGESADAAIFTRKVGHSQRGGRPILFDRFHAAQLGGRAVDVLLEGQNNAIATLNWNRDDGFYVDSLDANMLRDPWGHIHARLVHPSFYDTDRMRPSRMGVEYLLQIFTRAIGHDDLENISRSLFDSGNLFRPYHSPNTDIARRIRYLD